MEIKFELVDEGCLMFENEHGRWIIEHPKEGYFETHSKLWDTLVEHPDNPNQIPVKFLGSFETRRQATQHLKNTIRKHTFESVSGVENEFYSQEYGVK